MKKKHVIIVGAGASGLMAGIMAARNGAAVTILEQNEKPGKKSMLQEMADVIIQIWQCLKMHTEENILSLCRRLLHSFLCLIP